MGRLHRPPLGRVSLRSYRREPRRSRAQQLGSSGSRVVSNKSRISPEGGPSRTRLRITSLCVPGPLFVLFKSASGPSELVRIFQMISVFRARAGRYGLPAAHRPPEDDPSRPVPASGSGRSKQASTRDLSRASTKVGVLVDTAM